jgi:superfamily II DNA helicase RecQ
MPYKFFQIPTRGCDQSEHALNSFLCNHRVLSVARQFVDVGENSYWCFCVDYLESASAGKAKQAGRRSQVDYKELLAPDEFALFAKLRELRKELAQSEAVPVYSIFTNAQLADIVRKRTTSKESLRAIGGLGEARIEKYGLRVVEIAAEHWNKADEEDGKSV